MSGVLLIDRSSFRMSVSSSRSLSRQRFILASCKASGVSSVSSSNPSCCSFFWHSSSMSSSYLKMSSEICEIRYSNWRRLSSPSRPIADSSRNWQSRSYSSCLTSSMAAMLNQYTIYAQPYPQQSVAYPCSGYIKRRHLLLVQLFQQQLQSKSKFSLFMAFLNMSLRQVQSGCSSNSRLRLQRKRFLNSSGSDSHSLSMEIDSFFSMIFSYFSFLVFAFRFCQGTDPFTKQSSTLAMPSMSSLRPCSMPRCVLREAKRAVPVRFLLSLQGMCELSLSSYFLASPKSIMYILLAFLPWPVTKLSGFTSRWMNLRLWTYSIRSSIWYPTIKVVFRSYFFPLTLKRSSSDFPHRSITITLYSPSEPTQQTFGKPVSVVVSSCSPPRILASQKSCGLLVEDFSSFTAYSVWFLMLSAMNTSPNAPDPSFFESLQSFATMLSISYTRKLYTHTKESVEQEQQPLIRQHQNPWTGQYIHTAGGRVLHRPADPTMLRSGMNINSMVIQN